MPIGYRTASCVATSVENVLVVVWGGSPGHDDVDALEHASRELAAATGRRIAHFNFVPLTSGTGGLEDSVRKRFDAMMRDPAFPLALSAVIYPREGFVAALIRSILAGMVMASRSRSTVRFFGSVADAEEWILRQLTARNLGDLAPGALARALDHLQTATAA